jgi:hypothetical protein
MCAVCYTMVSGEFMDGFRFLGTDGTAQVVGLFVVFTLTGFLGMSCLAALTKRFGALKSAVTSTVRKGFTLVLSYFLFPEGKTFTIMHGFGTALFLAGLLLESTTRLKRGPNSNFMSEEDEEIGIVTGDLNEGEPLLPLAAAEGDDGVPGDNLALPISVYTANMPPTSAYAERGLQSGWMDSESRSAASLLVTAASFDSGSGPGGRSLVTASPNGIVDRSDSISNNDSGSDGSLSIDINTSRYLSHSASTPSLISGDRNPRKKNNND